MTPTDGPGPFAVLLQRYRAAAGLSQQELAERAGLSEQGISDLERGKRLSPYPATVRGLAKATFAWSYGLLDDAERTLLARLAVFAGGWTLEAAERICANNGQAIMNAYRVWTRNMY